MDKTLKKMTKKYWFRICFERECESDSEAEVILDEITDEFWQSDLDSDLSCTYEERNRK